jgi:thiamine-monophosphate kinase
MSLSEFGLIERYFRHCGVAREDVRVGVGDDAAVLECPPGQHLVAAMDTLVDGVHFPHGAPPDSIGYRALAVNLSDLAAMGARAAWALLALTLPEADEGWLSQFAAGFAKLARLHNLALVGGDTTRGPLCVTVQVLGHVSGSAMLRSGGRPGDALFVSGTPGDAAAGLALEQGRWPESGGTQYLRERFLFPTPRMELGERLREYASACIDVSDGLLGDAGKLAAASGCGAEIVYADLPLSEPLVRVAGAERAHELALTGGDDYELCFSVGPGQLAQLLAQMPPERWGYRRIGSLRQAPGIDLVRDGAAVRLPPSGYDHFAGTGR